MPLVVKDRVRETSTTAGTGTFTLAGAVTGYQSFSAIGNGNTTYYTIYLQGGNEWEVGIGTYTASGTTLSRDTVLASSAGGAKVSFSAGVKDVFVTYPAGRSVWYDTATNVTIDALTVSNNTILGDASTDTVQVNGYMGVGGAGLSSNAIRAVSTALTGADQQGIVSTITGTSAATSSISAFAAVPRTAASVFTVGAVHGLRVYNPIQGAGSTITDLHGVYIADQTSGTNNSGITSLVSSGTNKWNIYASGTAANYFAGNVGIGTTSPDYKLQVSGTSGQTFSIERVASSIGSSTSLGTIVGTGEIPTLTADGASIQFLGAGLWSATSAPGRIVFNTTPAATTTPVERFQLTTGEAVVNDPGEDYDFRIESDTNTHAFFLEGSSGNVGIGTSSPSSTLTVAGTANVTGNTTLGDASTDTVQVNGYMGVGGAGASSRSIAIASTALVGTSQFGIVNTPTFNSQATSAAYSYFARVQTEAAAFTLPFAAAYIASAATKGAGSTITALHGLYIDDQTQGTNNYGITSIVSGGTNKWNIYASGTAANYFAGDVGVNMLPASTYTEGAGAGRIQVGVTSGGAYTAIRASNNVSSTAFSFLKSRGASVGTNAAVVSGDSLGQVNFGGADGTNYLRAAQIEATVGGTVSSGIVPGKLSFFTATTSGVNTERLALTPTEAVFNDVSANYNFRVESDTNTHRLFVDGGADTVLMGTTTNTNSSKLVVDGTISETVGGVQYLVASQADIGTAPNEIPLNQYLGALAYEDTETPALDVGTGISTGTGTICKANGGQMGGIYRMTILIDLTGLNSGGTAGDIIGVNGTALPCYIARLPAMTVLGGRMTCLETPAGGDTDIDLYSATEGTGVEDQAITALTETQIINAGAQTVGTVTYFSADPAANAYFYLVGQSTSNATYTAGRFLIEIFGVQ